MAFQDISMTRLCCCTGLEVRLSGSPSDSTKGRRGFKPKIMNNSGKHRLSEDIG